MTYEERNEARERARAEKERKRKEREQLRLERRAKKKQEDEKKYAEIGQEEKIYKKPKVIEWKDTKFFLFVGVMMLVIFLLINIIKLPFLLIYENSMYGKDYREAIIIPNLTGYSEADAIKELRNLGFENIETQYIFDQYTVDKTVVKTTLGIGSQTTDIHQNVIVYVCDESLYRDTNNVEIASSMESNEQISLKGVHVISTAVNGDHFYALVQNKNKFAISDISYTVGFLNDGKSAIGNRVYVMEDSSVILPGQKYLIKDQIHYKDARSITITDFSFSTISVPENER